MCCPSQVFGSCRAQGKELVVEIEVPDSPKVEKEVCEQDQGTYPRDHDVSSEPELIVNHKSGMQFLV